MCFFYGGLDEKIAYQVHLWVFSGDERCVLPSLSQSLEAGRDSIEAA